MTIIAILLPLVIVKANLTNLLIYQMVKMTN